MPRSILKRDGPSSWISEESTWPATGIALAHNGIQFILEDLERLQDHTSIPAVTIRSLYEDLNFTRSFLERMQKSSFHHSGLKDLVGDLLTVVKALLVDTDSYVHRNIIEKNSSSKSSIPASDFNQHYSEVDSLVKKIRTFEQEIGNGSDESSSFSPENSTTRNNLSSILEDQIMIGFDDERTQLLDKLIGARKQLKVISIIGMGGIGKTTLAQSLFNDPQIVYHFHVRAWSFFSQQYVKRKSLHNILSYIIDTKDPVFNMDDESMGEKLYKSLKGKRYLIVIDGIWNIQQWNDINMYFPKDNTGSRILLTSRIRDVALQIEPDIAPHFLRFLTPDESWDLFKFKVFPENNDVPEDLRKLGKQIVERCKGLPLAICAIAGILVKEEKAEEWWRHVAGTIRMPSRPQGRGGREIPFTSDFSEHYMDTLELSYKHLPSTLQSCFLYLGTYSDDSSIPVRRLILSWIAEGLIQQQTTDKSLEDVAEDCLRDLIHRSLVMVVEKRSDGGIKSCRIHDLLRDLCHTKVKEKKFLQPICQCGPVFELCFFRFSLMPHIVGPFHRCWPYFHFYESPFYASVHEVFTDESMPVYRFLRRLELRNIVLLNFPEQISILFHLRYLELQVDHVTSHLPSVFQLWNLETCILYVAKGGQVEVTYEFWKMLKLRHLQISQDLVFSDPRHFTESGLLESLVLDEATRPTVLENLQTISQLRPSGSVHNALARTPNLRKLGLHMSLSDSNEHFSFPNLAHLDLLQTLKFEYQTLGCVPPIIHHLELDKFPPNLKKLTLIGSHLEWEDMSIISMLPNLEILKLKDNFFSGPLWETSDDGFYRLKFLKLSHMDLQKWISSSDHFPKLEHLVLNGCLNLEEIPSEIGDIPTLQTIKVYGSSNSTMESANLIQESQKLMGNDDLKVFIYHQFEDY